MISSSSRTENFRYAIRNLVRAAEEVERAGREVSYFNIGDPQVYGFHPPAHVVEAIARASRDKFTGYTHSAGLPEARAAVASYATSLGVPTAPSEVLITSGASEAADLLLTALVNPGDEVLLPAPGYPIYAAILHKLGAVPRYYKLNDSDNWLPSPAEVRSLTNVRTRALVLINPNNPTGAVTPDALTAAMIEVAAERNLLVIADEVYRELCFGNPPTASSVIAREMSVPLVTLESLSKTHLVPGWRVGWMRFTCAEKMRDVIRAVGSLADGRLCSPTLTQYAVRPALEGSKSFQGEFVSEIRKRRDTAVAHVNRIASLSCAVPEAAFYLMIKVNELIEESDEAFVLQLLKDTGILVVHGSGFGTDPRLGYFRMVYLAEGVALDKAFGAISGFMSKRSR
ncbi:MAG TPA: aminotransferase class I/II-fold pyridoxal phosphate-dependent enzyme [Pyrinomonadaceae bacterium]|nr:aminotransferase class I/II-fold pyridoxal phosphate-dependent enzyme [Pyrinomonadaceae bacterium]